MLGGNWSAQSLNICVCKERNKDEAICVHTSHCVTNVTIGVKNVRFSVLKVVSASVFKRTTRFCGSSYALFEAL